MTTRSFRLLGGILPALALASCATVSPEARVRSGLIEAGLPPSTAACMADRMVDRLSIAQLRRIESLSSLRNSHIGGMSVDRLLYKLRALEDPEIFAVTSKAALACTLLD